MNPNFWYLLIVSAFLALFHIGCSEQSTMPTSTPSNGVEVGNGRHASYFSSRYRIKVTFPSSLNVRVISDEAFEVSNDSDDRIAGNVISYVRFHVFSAGRIQDRQITSQLELADYVRGAYPTLQFQPATLSNTRGLAWKNTSDHASEMLYYLITPSKDVVFIEAKAHKDGDGIQAVQSVINSFTYDDLPPELSEIEIESPKSELQTVRRFIIGASDTQSGIHESASIVLVPVGPAQPRTFKGPYESIQTMVAKENGRYVLEVPVPKMYPGHYAVQRVKIWDRVGNASTYVFPLPGEEAATIELQNGEIEWKGKPILIVVAPESSIEVAKPHIAKLKLSSKEVSVGATATVQFQIPETTTANIGFRAWLDIRDEASPDQVVYNLRVYSDALPLGDGWYATKFETQSVMGGKSFFIHAIEVENKMDGGRTTLRGKAKDANYSDSLSEELPILRFRVLDRTLLDKFKPQVTAIKFSNATVVVGGTASLMFHATDNLSGLANFSGYFGKLSPDSADKAVRKKKIVLKGAIKNLGADWYSIDFTVPADAPLGSYFPELLLINDLAGNSERLTLPEMVTTRPLPADAKLVGNQDNELELPRIEITDLATP